MCVVVVCAVVVGVVVVYVVVVGVVVVYVVVGRLTGVAGVTADTVSAAAECVIVGLIKRWEKSRFRLVCLFLGIRYCGSGCEYQRGMKS